MASLDRPQWISSLMILYSCKLEQSDYQNKGEVTVITFWLNRALMHVLSLYLYTVWIVISELISYCKHLIHLLPQCNSQSGHDDRMGKDHALSFFILINILNILFLHSQQDILSSFQVGVGSAEAYVVLLQCLRQLAKWGQYLLQEKNRNCMQNEKVKTALKSF